MASCSNHHAVRYVSAEHLAARLRGAPPTPSSPGPSDPFQIIDVRDSDFAGGHLRGAVHLPRDHLKYNLTEYVDRWLGVDAANHASGTAAPPRTPGALVFHCMMSQVRGPSCATMVSRELAEREEKARMTGEVLKGPEVWVLDGGFEGFVERFRKEEELFEGLDRRMWG